MIASLPCWRGEYSGPQSGRGLSDAGRRRQLDLVRALTTIVSIPRILCGSIAAAALSGALGALAGPQGLGDDRPRLPPTTGLGVGAAAFDADADGDTDLARLRPDGLDILLQTRSGRFVVAGSGIAALPVGQEAVAIAAGALLPGAPAADLVVAIAGGPSQLLRNLGSGAFVRVLPDPFPPRGSSAAVRVLIADVDRAPLDDVLLLFDNAPAQLFRSDGVGGFVELIGALPPFSLQSPIATLTDLDQDGDADLLVMSRGVTAVPLLLRNDGTGRFQPATFNATGFVATSLAVGDVDGDSLPDIVITEAGATALAPRIFRNLGGGQFQRINPVSSFTVTNAIDLDIRDLDNDQRRDLSVLQLDGSVRVGYGVGAAQFAAPVDILPLADRRALLVSDLENDGDADWYAVGRTAPDGLVLAGRNRSVWPSEMVTLPAMGRDAPGEVVPIDATGDADPDLVVLMRNGAGTVLTNDGSARFAPRAGLLPSLPPANYRFALGAAVDGGVVDDLIVVGQGLTSPQIRVLINRAPTGFTDEPQRLPPLAFLTEIVAVAAGDFVRNAASAQHTDLVVADAAGLVWLLANNAGNFVAPVGPVGPFGAILDMLAGDVNQDTMLDLVVVATAGTFRVLLGDSSGGLVPQPFVSVGGPLQHAALGDADGDGRLDLLLATAPAGGARLQVGRGDGTFVDRTATLPPTLPAQISALALLPGARVLIGDRATRSVVTFAATGGGFTLPRSVELRGAGIAHRFAVADLDVDGDQDVTVCFEDQPPIVLFGRERQLQQTGVCQIGRQLSVRLHGPASGAAVVFFGLSGFRFDLPPWGLLRLNPAGMTQLLSVPIPITGLADVSLPTSPNFLPVQLLFQGATLNAQFDIRFTNLEVVSLVAF